MCYSRSALSRQKRRIPPLPLQKRHQICSTLLQNKCRRLCRHVETTTRLTVTVNLLVSNLKKRRLRHHHLALRRRLVACARKKKPGDLHKTSTQTRDNGW